MPPPTDRFALHIAEPDPFGEVTFVPPSISGKPESDVAGKLAHHRIKPRPDEVVALPREGTFGKALSEGVHAITAMVRRTA